MRLAGGRAAAPPFRRKALLPAWLCRLRTGRTAVRRLVLLSSRPEQRRARSQTSSPKPVCLAMLDEPPTRPEVLKPLPLNCCATIAAVRGGNP